MTYRAFLIITALALLSAACGSEDPAVAQPVLKRPPEATPGASAGDGPGYVFAIRKLYLGETDRDGNASTNAWKLFGYDIDGDVSSQESTGLCQPVGNAPASYIHSDGEQGLDNAFGKQVMPTIAGLQEAPTSHNNEAITAGSVSLLLRIDALGAGSDYVGLNSFLYVAGPRATPPTFTGEDVWPVRSEALAAPPSLDSGVSHHAEAYVTGHTWVARVPVLDLPITLWEQELTLPIRNVTISMDLSEDRSNASNGIIAGTLDTERLLEDMHRVGEHLSIAVCGPKFEEQWQKFEEQVRQAQDILQDGSQAPSVPCNALSIGLGFEAVRAGIGEVAPPVEVPYACE